MALTSKDWLEVGAVLLSPLIAVQVTLFIQRRQGVAQIGEGDLSRAAPNISSTDCEEIGSSSYTFCTD